MFYFYKFVDLSKAMFYVAKNYLRWFQKIADSLTKNSLVEALLFWRYFFTFWLGFV